MSREILKNIPTIFAYYSGKMEPLQNLLFGETKRAFSVRQNMLNLAKRRTILIFFRKYCAKVNI
jgi:hypothetical protein